MTVPHWRQKYPADLRQSMRLRQAISSLLRNYDVRSHQIAVGLSGGPDSALLAVELSILAESESYKPQLLHIHHGLQTPADEWSQRVHQLGLLLGLPCHSRRVEVAQNTGKGTEAAARDARYQALSQWAQDLDISFLLLAHHQDDQAETVLLRLLRGSGPQGLAAMRPAYQRSGVTYLRPWLAIPRASIWTLMQQFTIASGWQPVYDPSNYQERYTRSAVRERLAPALNARWPGWQANLGRHARLAQETSLVLDEVADSDLATLAPSVDCLSFSLEHWRDLSAARQANMMRYWLRMHGLQAPTEARLAELMRQLRGLHALGHDRQMRLRHAGHWIYCERGRVGLRRDNAS